MKKVIFVLALSGLVSFSSYAATTVASKANTEFKKDGDKKKKKGSKKECCSSSDSKCCEKKDDAKKTKEQPK
ncbi:MAG TPA: hypothetical protein VNB90_06115 [Cytophagaceae bacterium]|jgi:hypothetical protein|nr:hypothetical protein [Cytophagaceae bacterium]